MRSLTAATLLAIVEYMVLSFMCGQARARYKVKAPATTGDPMFERYFRVQQNTLESLIIFIPALWLFGLYVNSRAAGALGLIYVLSRAVYARGYIADPEKRAIGAVLSFLTNAVLTAGAIVGLVLTFVARSAS